MEVWSKEYTCSLRVQSEALVCMVTEGSRSWNAKLKCGMRGHHLWIPW